MPDYQTIHDSDSAFQKTTSIVFPDNSSGEISAQDSRDAYASLRDKDKIKVLWSTGSASLTLDVSAALVHRIFLTQSIGSTSLVDEPPCNLVWPSENLTHANWLRGSSTFISATNAEDAFGLSTADRYTVSAVANTQVQQLIPVKSGLAYRFQFYAKLAPSSSSGNFNFGWTNAEGGGLSLNQTDGSATSTWGFFSSVWTADSTTTRYVGLDNRANTVNTDIYLARMQVVPSSAREDYVKTQAGPVSEIAQVQLWLQQDATGGRTVTYGSNILWENSTTGVLSTTGGMVDAVSLTSIDGGAFWFATLTAKGFPNA